MPEPGKGEARSAYMSRCVPKLIDEGKDSEQAAAICYSMWRRKKAKELLTTALDWWHILRGDTDG